MRQTGTRAKGSLGTIPTKSERLARGVWAELSGTAEKRYGRGLVDGGLTELSAQ